MALFVTEKGEGLASLPCAERTLHQLKAATSPLAQKILSLLARSPRYSHELAKALGMHEQKIYYHMRKLESAGLITIERREEHGGATAKYYRASAPAFTVLLAEPKPTNTITHIDSATRSLLEPFIIDGKADFLIVIGSPQAHGPSMVQARDGGYAIDLALFLGSYLNGSPEPVVKLDTEFKKEDWQRNLIVIGGPIVNTVAAEINRHLLIRFSEDGKTIIDTRTKSKYANDQVGIIVKGENPRARKRAVLFIAGRRQAGTKAAILAFFKHLAAIATNPVCVVEGRDLDSDGVVDDAHLIEQ